MQLATLDLSQSVLSAWIRSLAQINRAFVDKDAAKFLELVEENKTNFGLSLTLLKKVISAKYSLLAGVEGFDPSSVLSSFLSPRRDMFAAAFDDSVSWDKSYIAARRFFYGHVRKRLKNSNRYLISDIFNFAPAANRPQVLQAYGRWSAGDALAYLEREALRQKAVGGDPAELTRFIPADLHRQWEETFSDFSLNEIAGPISDESSFEEYRLFPHASAWCEYAPVLEWRDAIEGTIGDRLTGIFPARKGLGGPAVPVVQSVEELLPSSRESHRTTPVQLPIDLQNCGKFHRTVALMATIDSVSNFSVKDGKTLLDLLDSTVNVALLLPVEDLKKTLPEQPHDRLFTYLRSALLHDAGEGRRAQHALRRALQDIVHHEHGDDIVDFAAYLDASCKHVANHLYYTCSEQFLTELYRLYPTADAVAAAQISMHKWFGEAHHETSAVDLARTLELNLRLRAIRGSIDDTRLYVDPLRFQEWALEVLSAGLRELASSKEVIAEQIGAPVDTDNKLEAVQSEYARFVALLCRAYLEFCTNKFYGVDSYIGRRIRHGTLSGVLVDELRPVIESAIEATQYLSPAFARYLTTWRKQLSGVIDEFGSTQLYIRSKDKPNGMFSPQANASFRAGEFNRMAQHVLSSLGPNRPTNSAVKLIYEHCWLLLEVDLRALRDSVDRLYASLAINAASYTKNLDEHASRLVTAEIRTLNMALKERFEMLGQWLTQPTSTRPTASFEQLMRVVLEEVGGRYPGFAPEVDFSNVAQVDLFGHRFHTVYDILFVLIDNAAKHGVRDGEIRLNATPTSSKEEPFMNVILSVSSQMYPDRLDACKREVELWMNANIDDALVQQGKSGLRKARLLVRDNEEFMGFYADFSEEFVTFSAHLCLKRE